MEKRCLRCSSSKDKRNKNCENDPTRARENGNDCRNLLCTTVYNDDFREIHRSCYTWRIVKMMIEYPIANNLTIEWCMEEDCNSRPIKDFPGCVGEESLFYQREKGCLTVSNSSFMNESHKRTRLLYELEAETSRGLNIRHYCNLITILINVLQPTIRLLV
ncbi:hypothetical protein C0J52_02714 [Blattella germanica]|nr:hypothetical protein C0J52_02714 [Blattella germanica]